VKVVGEKYVERRLIVSVTLGVLSSTAKLTLEISGRRETAFFQRAQEPPPYHVVVQLQTRQVNNHHHIRLIVGVKRNHTRKKQEKLK